MTYGREYGDSLLSQIASRLNNIPTNFNKMISRGSGAQFYLLTVRNKSDFAENQIFKLLQNSLSRDFSHNENTIQIEFKIGQSDLIDAHSNIDDMISECETAISQIVDKESIYYNHYSKEIYAKLERKNNISQMLTQSITKNKLYVVYQPVVNITTNKIDFCESLIRWNCNCFDDMISPSEFIPIAEKNGFVKNIGIFVLNDILRNYDFFIQNNIKVSINLSVKELTDENFADNTIELFNKANASPNQLTFEITEYTQFIDNQIVHRNISNLIDYGFSFSIDDFGTGYSTFQQISRYSGSLIKIDKSFVDNIDTDTYNQAIVSAIVNMATALGIKVVAEGVESDIQLQRLKSFGVNYIQGYYFYKPMKLEDLKNILKHI